ncbi:MAG: transposase, IS605 OrfB family [Thermoplasmatales archaeon Gpl]|jgi:putative transposase|nr:MAG: transposase, IS605 OrfB family [Thermoplasmatales archaeon Gpl]
MIKALKVRLYPSEEQKVLLEKHFGSCRFVWNHFLEVRNKYYAEHKNDGKKGLSGFDTMRMLTVLKKEITWLNEINSQSLQHSLVKLEMAFKAFFRHNSNYPTFRSKKDNQYFIVPSGFKTEGDKLIIPKFMEGIRYRDKSTIPENIKQIIVTKDVDRYYAFMQYETNVEISKGKGIIGIDMGIRAFITASDGIQVEPLNALRKKEKRLAREQRKLSRKEKGSKNRKKQILKVQKIHQNIRDARIDFNHKVSTAIAKHYGTVVVEDLNIHGMQRNPYLAKSITDQGWGEFKTMLTYKLGWREAELIQIGRFDPSSRMCSGCGNIKRDLKLSDRIYHCSECSISIDRDLNAAINIRNMGLRKIGKGIPEFTPVESATAAELLKGGLRVATL